MNQNYFAVEVQAKQAAIEAVEFALGEAGAEGTELNLLGKSPNAETVSIIGYFITEPDAESIRSWIASGLNIYELPHDAVHNVEFRTIENRDWLAEWKKHWKPTETAKFIVAPTWSEIENTEKTVLRIEPGMAFGTGTHETTRLCLKAIEENYDGGSFFDVGTGTGVLAMAAAKLFPKAEIVACDTDDDSVKIAAENAEINGLADKIKFYVGSISVEIPQFEFVCANLTADVIVPLLPLLTEKAQKTLVLSGILREQQDWVESELSRSKLLEWQVETQGEWISIVATKHNQ